GGGGCLLRRREPLESGPSRGSLPYLGSALLSPYGHPRAAVPQYGRDISMGDPIMKKLSMLGIVGGAALLAAVPVSLQWPQVGSALPLLTVSHADAQPYRRHVRRVYRRAYYGYPYSYGRYYPYSYGYYPYSYGGYYRPFNFYFGDTITALGNIWY